MQTFTNDVFSTPVPQYSSPGTTSESQAVSTSTKNKRKQQSQVTPLLKCTSVPSRNKPDGKSITEYSQPTIRKNSTVPVKPKISPPKVAPVSKANENRLSREDIELISRAIISFRDQEGMEQSTVNEIIQKDAKKSEDSRMLWKFVSDSLPHLPKQKVINFCRRKFHNYEARGSWTADQDEELSALHEKYPGKWKKIGEIMSRFPEDCRDRWRNYLVCGDRMRKVRWEFEEEEKLRLVVKEYLDNYHSQYGATEVDDLQLIDWQTISRMLGHTRSRLQCSLKWRAIRERYETDNEDSNNSEPLSRTQWRLDKAEKVVYLMSPNEKLQLLYAIRESGVKQISKIPWVQIKKTKNSCIKSNKLALRIAFSRLMQNVPNSEKMKLQEIVQYLINQYESSSPNEPENFRATTPKQLKRKNSLPTPKPQKKQKLKSTQDELQDANSPPPI
ncbi:DNA-binding protein REB1 [Golovinomyces cichoracearum]|uniref:DNA-binding protein REB1 n=1 Tax=Golovinomyces cichoracearum TaxID=62708 RepID=A0A420IFD4_9PEZI|nr:DNA-binding protein REB1 [Golovinomyces cichoracearum]